MTLADKASALLALHHGEEILVLPNVWDAWSARVVAAAGFAAISIGSHPLADSRGQGDNEQMSLDDALDGVRRICSAVDVPVTADLESGYDTPAGELIERMLEAGAVGLNIEDTVHSEQRMRTASEHADYIGALRQAADASGVDVVINARTDVFLKPPGTFDDPLAEAIARLTACQEAGARCLYPVAAPDVASISALVEALDAPINIIANPVAGSAAGGEADLQALGVRRITFGPLLQKELGGPLTNLVSGWL